MGDDNTQERLLISSGNEEQADDLKHQILDESKKIWEVAFPGVLARIASFGSVLITQSFIGHLSRSDLAGFALVQSLSLQFVTGVLIGMSSATETLCGQAFGAGQLHMMGIYLQRSWIINFAILAILLPIFVFGRSIFTLLGEDGDIARSAGYESFWFIPLIYSYIFHMSNQMFLQAQQKNSIIGWVSVLQFAVHIPLSWYFVYPLNWGTPGAILALGISSWLVVLGEFAYIFGGYCPESWKGFTMAAFKDLWPVIKLSVSSGVMLCLELWYNAVLVLLAGYMKNAEVEVSAFSIGLNISSWVFMISVGLYGAACIRVANELGRGDAKAVKFSIKVTLSTSSLIGVCFWVICLVFGHKIGYLFTGEKAVAEAVSELSVLLSFSILFNSMYIILSGVAVGAGLQGTVAIITLCCYYLIGIPIGAVLGYVGHLQVKGIWMGMMCGVIAQTLALSIMTWRTDWDAEVAKTKQRLARWYLKSSDESNHNSGHI